MESWIIINKLIILIYLVLHYVHGNIHKPWIVFALLLYLCLNISIYIVKQAAAKKSGLLLSIILTILFYYDADSLFILFFPLNLYELVSYYIDKKWIIFTMAFFPVLFIMESVYSLYILVAAFSFTIFTMASIYTSKLRKLENHMDEMRKDIQKLTRSLNENNEYMRQSEYTFKLEERNRLSQTIHDQIGHSMTGALIQMEAAKRLVEKDTDKAKELLQNSINILKEGIEKIRVTLKNIKPPTEQMGMNRIKLLVDEFAAKHDMKTIFRHKGNLEVISPIHWTIIHQNVTEALTNTMKYANATVVSIEIHVLNTFIKVEVKDNGKGSQRIRKGLGITGMEERTASMNGTIIADGTNGFSVTTLLPIQ
ncbi:sensor histidine kinase [Ectobacillus funiculus]|uniref:sensor histidine kinase n=1 Tax=Ectobacillus funiculus TaxID=137993 RepID=UPI00397DCF6F